MASDFNQGRNGTYWRRINGDNASNDGDRSNWIRMRIHKLREERRCMRCTDRGHLAHNCRNPIVCLICNKLGHKSNQCRTITTIPPLSRPQIAPQKTSSRISSSDTMMHGVGAEFHHSPAVDALEQAFSRSVILYDDEHWGKDRVRQALRRLVPRFDWKVRHLDDWKYLIESPNAPWLHSVLSVGKVRLENKDITVQPWDPAMDEGLRLISVWVKFWGFPMKLWHFEEFQELFKPMKGTVLELDELTAQHLDFRYARVRVGVCDVKHIPEGTWTTYVTPLGFIERHDVIFEVEENPFRAPRGPGMAPPPPPPARNGRDGRNPPPNTNGGVMPGSGNTPNGRSGTNMGGINARSGNTQNMQIDEVFTDSINIDHCAKPIGSLDKGKGIMKYPTPVRGSSSNPQNNAIRSPTVAEKGYFSQPVFPTGKQPRPDTIDALWHQITKEQQQFNGGMTASVIEDTNTRVEQIALEVNASIDDMLLQIEQERRSQLQEETPPHTPHTPPTLTNVDEKAFKDTTSKTSCVENITTPILVATDPVSPMITTPPIPSQTVVTIRSVQQYPRRSTKLRVKGITQTVMSRAQNRKGKRGREQHTKEGISLLQLYPFDRVTNQEIVDIFNVNRIQLGDSEEQRNLIIQELRIMPRLSFENILKKILENNKKVEVLKTIVQVDNNGGQIVIT